MNPTPSGIVTDVSPVQLSKALLPISETVSGIFNDVSPLHS